jgi:GxxExxY protein
MQHQALTQTIIGCAFKVHNTLGFGFLESVYHNSLILELSRCGLHSQSKQELTVYYEGEPVGVFEPDLLVEREIVLELKSVRQLAKAHELQLVNYLVATGLDIGLLINFGPEGVEVKRKYRTFHATDK